VSEIDRSETGYPEEAPAGADPRGGDESDESPAREHADDAPDNEDGKATGNPKNA
jgi:hypothetical protein